MIHVSATPVTPGPFSVSSLSSDLLGLGVRRGHSLMVHASISSLGWVSGGGVALLKALEAVVGSSGCVVVPTFTTYLCDPKQWVSRSVPEAWHEQIRETLPLFDPYLHRSQPGLGAFPELLRSHPAAQRSWHPIYSFAALGSGSSALTADVPLDFALGKSGVLGRFADGGGKILTLGMPWWSKCTLFHLSESLTPYRGRRIQRVPVRTDRGNELVWRDTQQLVLHDGDFAEIGAAGQQAAPSGLVGAAEATLLDALDVVASAGHWMKRHRDFSTAQPGARQLSERSAPPTAL